MHVCLQIYMEMKIELCFQPPAVAAFFLHFYALICLSSSWDCSPAVPGEYIPGEGYVLLNVHTHTLTQEHTCTCTQKYTHTHTVKDTENRSSSFHSSDTPLISLPSPFYLDGGGHLSFLFQPSSPSARKVPFLLFMCPSGFA